MQSCKIAATGDIQLESVLTPLLFLQSTGAPHDLMVPSHFRGARVLDFGCGSGRLLSALHTYSPEVLANIDYVGWDVSESALSEATRLANAPLDTTAGRATPPPLPHRLRSCRFELAPEVPGESAEHEFDVIILVNVIHHFAPSSTLPDFLGTALRLLRLGGYLVVEDFFLGDHPPDLSVDRLYDCADAIYWGPAELSCICASGWGGIGTYRYFGRQGPNGSWFGYTYVIRNSGRTAAFPAYAADTSRFLPGIAFAMAAMKERANAAGRTTLWYHEYGLRLAQRLELDGPWSAKGVPRGDFSVHNPEDLARLYTHADPYPSHQLGVESISE